MDTLQVFQASTGGSRHSSRTPSPSRYVTEQQQLSRDRETDTTAFGATSSSSNLRYRTQSPSTTQRRSRERERIDRDNLKEMNQSINQSAEKSIDADTFDDSRMAEELLGYPSLNSEEFDYTDSDPNKHFSSTPSSRHHRSNSLQAIDRLTTKIACTKESIRREQTARDENVNEYLKLAASADKTQLQRIKAVFEKKNQKSAHIISQYQKKLESYNKRYKDLEQQQMMKAQQQKDYRQPREVLRDVGQGLKNVGGNIRDGVSTVMSKPREFAHLIKNKFGSADNINQMSSNQDGREHHDIEPTTIDNNQTQGQISSNNLERGGGNSSGKFSGDHDSECSSVTSDSAHGGLFLKCKHTAGSGSGGGAGNSTKDVIQSQQIAVTLKSILDELKERKEDFEKLKQKVERLEATQKELADLSVILESERYRAEVLSTQINDLTELHQTEIENLKQAMADMEEKVQYQSDERLRDVNEVLENCQTRIQKMEHLSQQQYVTVEGIDNSNARALVVKLINVVLTVLQVVLLLTATAAGIIMPFLKTRVRVLTTVISVLFIIFIVRTWPDLRENGIVLFHKIVK
ncbi:hypothetical protein PVAND_011589 [Polypedilum vanderplanki]|uniref:Transmembrane and coiled-coil domains protein 1 n=1 Tax=Polypedilum vanderplanki TaxID=319348 RepID=A0A9J6CJX8_POLVA|nr:hypothetical protein PVAND_011589 [Polypedilum vanderplanki]